MSDLDLEGYTRIAVQLPTELARALVGLEARAWGVDDQQFTVEEQMALAMLMGSYRDAVLAAGD